MAFPVWERAAADEFVVVLALVVVPNARVVVGGEHLGDEVTTAADAGLLEDTLEVLLDGVGGEVEVEGGGDSCGGVALQDVPGDLLLARGQPEQRHQQGGDSRRPVRLDDDSCLPSAGRRQRCPVQGEPSTALVTRW